MPNSGAIFRCELDGTKVDRYSSGERNAQELAFDSLATFSVWIMMVIIRGKKKELSISLKEVNTDGALTGNG